MSNITSPATSTAQIETNTTGLPANTRSLNGDTGTQITKSGSANNGTTIIHTVTAGKKLFLSSAVVACGFGVSNAFEFFVTNAADVTQYSIYKGSGGAAGNQSVGLNFNNPIKIPAGYKLKCLTNSAGAGIGVCINGWEETA